jgi:serine/threonine-protein kinase RsbW
MSDPDVLLTVPATMRHLNIVGAAIAELLAREPGLTEPAADSYNTQLAVQEICANIVEHAYAGAPGRITITLSVVAHPHRLVMELSDTGRPFDPELVAAPDLDEVHEGGYGLFLARELLDELSYETHGGHNRWRLVKHLQGA